LNAAGSLGPTRGTLPLLSGHPAGSAASALPSAAIALSAWLVNVPSRYAMVTVQPAPLLVNVTLAPASSAAFNLPATRSGSGVRSAPGSSSL
jgi:hypothetical protein